MTVPTRARCPADGTGGEDEAGTGWAAAPVVGAKLKDGQSCIVGWADIGVGVDPPGPFALLPQSFAEKVEALIAFQLQALQACFCVGWRRFSDGQPTRPAERAAAFF